MKIWQYDLKKKALEELKRLDFSLAHLSDNDFYEVCVCGALNGEEWDQIIGYGLLAPTPFGFNQKESFRNFLDTYQINDVRLNELA